MTALSTPGRALIAAAVAGLVCAGCANPLDRATSDRYADQCRAAEEAGDHVTAEGACYRALVNVDWGGLGPESKSQRLYNLARVKKPLGKHDEAIDLLQQSLVIETGLTGADSLQTGRRLIELAANEAFVDRWDDGADALERAAPIAPRYAGAERVYARSVFRLYGERFASTGDAGRAMRFRNVANAL